MRAQTKDPVVLLIEEDETIRESLGDMLTERGYAAVAVATPSNGMLLLERGFRPRVIVLDPFTPNGAAAFKEQLAANPTLMGTPLVLGPRGASPERQIRRTLPREHHLLAPLDVHELLKVVHGYCRPWG
jgi:CheY-like chemotaxis protein